jgi:hypothetical protein
MDNCLRQGERDATLVLVEVIELLHGGFELVHQGIASIQTVIRVIDAILLSYARQLKGSLEMRGKSTPLLQTLSRLPAL